MAKTLEALTLKDLYTKEEGAKQYDKDNVSIFINVNRFNKLFIRANVYPDQTKTFKFNTWGLITCKRWLEEVGVKVYSSGENSKVGSEMLMDMLKQYGIINGGD